MNKSYRYIGAIFLATALTAPIAVIAAPAPQAAVQVRVYDAEHKDYHNWDANEDRSYQRYRTEHHEKRDFVQLSTRQQTVYWNWRHNNPDNR